MQHLSYSKWLWILQGKWSLAEYSSVSQSFPISGKIWQHLAVFPKTSVYSHKKPRWRGLPTKILPSEKPRLSYLKSTWENSCREFSFIISLCSHSNTDKLGTNPELGTEFTLYRLPELQTYFASFWEGLRIVMFPFPRDGQAHISDVPTSVHGGVRSSLLGNCSSSKAENRTMPGLAGGTEVTVWPFPLSVGHWESAQIEHEGRIRELLTSSAEGLFLPAWLMAAMSCRPEGAFPAVAGPSKNWRLISPEIIKQEDGNTVWSVQITEQQ